MKLNGIPFEGLFVVYKRINGNMTRLFAGESVKDIPAAYKSADVLRLYPYDDSIIVEIK